MSSYCFSDVLDKFNDLERQLAVQSKFMADLDTMQQVLATVSYDGILMWKIRDYNCRKGDAVSGRTLSLYSQPFYTHRHGYQMCARVYLNGDGTGRGTHMSLFFVLMKGDHDELLTWPFKHKIKLQLLDQSGIQRHVVNSFYPDERSNSFKRPMAEMNVASGCPEFVSHIVLENDSNYLQNDTLFIKIEVDIAS